MVDYCHLGADVVDYRHCGADVVDYHHCGADVVDYHHCGADVVNYRHHNCMSFFSDVTLIEVSTIYLIWSKWWHRYILHIPKEIEQ